MAGRGSRFHAALDRRRWGWARSKCFEAAGWKCSRCGRRGRLECHHIVRLEAGGDAYAQSNLASLCRTCHIQEHRGDGETPGRAEWRELVSELTLRGERK